MTDSPAVAVVLGTRPEIIKLAPVLWECERRGLDSLLVHTGQHYSDELDSVFFNQLDLPEPAYNLEVGSAPHAEQTGRMLVRLGRVIRLEHPEAVVVQGDTNSTLAGGLVASKTDCQLGHVEAGLRSGDWSMPEEVNRVLVDHASDHLFAPTHDAADNLAAEGIDGDRVVTTGNTIVDAVDHFRELARERTNVLSELGVEPGEFYLLTAHRPENVDDPDRFADLLTGVAEFAAARDTEVIYPIHPRSADRLAALDIEVPEQIRTIDPLGFLSFLRLEAAAALVFTDSGGVQEESCILGTPCVTLRDSTERPETIAVGANVLAGVNPSVIRESARTMLNRPVDWSNPFGDGRAAERIVDTLVSNAPRTARSRSR